MYACFFVCRAPILVPSAQQGIRLPPPQRRRVGGPPYIIYLSYPYKKVRPLIGDLASAAMYQTGFERSKPTFKGIPFETAQKHASTGRPAVQNLVHWYMQCTKYVAAMYQTLRGVSARFPLVHLRPRRRLTAGGENVGTLVYCLRRLDLVHWGA